MVGWAMWKAVMDFLPIATWARPLVWAIAERCALPPLPISTTSRIPKWEVHPVNGTEVGHKMASWTWKWADWTISIRTTAPKSSVTWPLPTKHPKWNIRAAMWITSIQATSLSVRILYATIGSCTWCRHTSSNIQQSVPTLSWSPLLIIWRMITQAWVIVHNSQRVQKSNTVCSHLIHSSLKTEWHLHVSLATFWHASATTKTENQIG